MNCAFWKYIFIYFGSCIMEYKFKRENLNFQIIWGDLLNYGGAKRNSLSYFRANLILRHHKFWGVCFMHPLICWFHPIVYGKKWKCTYRFFYIHLTYFPFSFTISPVFVLLHRLSLLLLLFSWPLVPLGVLSSCLSNCLTIEKHL